MAQSYLKTQPGTRLDFQLRNSTAPKRLELGLQNFMRNQPQGRTTLSKNFSQIGQAVYTQQEGKLSTQTIYFSKTIRVRRPKFYGHEHRASVFIVYKFSKNRITKGGEKENLFYLRNQLDYENRFGTFCLLNIYNSRFLVSFQIRFPLSLFILTLAHFRF